MGWKESAVDHQLHGEVDRKQEGYYDFARLMDGATQVSCSGVFDNM